MDADTANGSFFRVAIGVHRRASAVPLDVSFVVLCVLGVLCGEIFRCSTKRSEESSLKLRRLGTACGASPKGLHGVNFPELT